MQPSFTTPIARAWIPFLRDQLVAGGFLQETYGFQTRCGVINAKTADLDKIVSEGLKSGRIWIPQED
jgi:hypothetical protein